MKNKISDGWKISRLDKFLKINMGQSPPSKSYNEKGIGLAFLQGVTEFGDVRPQSKVWCTEPLKIALPDEILFSVRAPVGDTNLADSQYCIGRGVSSLRPKNADSEYCFYLLRQFKDNFRKFSQGTTYDAINRTDLAQTNFIYTSNIKEQKKIALILSKVDTSIKKTKRFFEKNKFLKFSLMQKLLIDYTEERKPYRLKNLTFKIGDGIHSTPKYVDYSDFHFINGNNLTNGSIVFSNNTKNVNEEEYLKYKLELNENTVFLSINGTIGNVALYNNEKIVLGKSVCYLICNDKLDKKFLYYLLTSDYFNKYFRRELTGSTISNLSLTSIRNAPISIPELNEQEKIVTILSSADKRILSEKNYLKKLIRIKNGLMDDLLTGKTRVSI